MTTLRLHLLKRDEVHEQVHLALDVGELPGAQHDGAVTAGDLGQVDAIPVARLLVAEHAVLAEHLLEVPGRDRCDRWDVYVRVEGIGARTVQDLADRSETTADLERGLE